MIGWFLLAGVPIQRSSLYVCCAARFLIGLTNGAAYTTTPVYLSEITAPRVRGTCTVLAVIATKFGLLLIYVIGAQMPVARLSVAGLVPLCLFAVLFVWMPETPYYHLCHGNELLAERTLRQLRGSDAKLLADELNEMRKAIALRLPSQRAIWLLIWRVPSNRRSVRLLLVYGAAIALCGSQAMNSYAELVFGSVPPSGRFMRAGHAAVVLAAVQLVFACGASAAADTIGRRPLVLTSLAGTMVCNAVIAVCLSLRRQNVDGIDVTDTATAWIQLTATIVFFACFVLGLSSMFGVLFAELFPTNVRCTAAAIVTTHGAIWSAIVGKLFQVIGDRLGGECAFVAFAGCGALALLYMWLELPETKRQSLQRIQEERADGTLAVDDNGDDDDGVVESRM